VKKPGTQGKSGHCVLFSQQGNPRLFYLSFSLVQATRRPEGGLPTQTCRLLLGPAVAVIDRLVYMICMA